MQTDGTTETVRQYYAIAWVTAGMREGSIFYYFLTDHLGSVVGVMDSTGTLVSEARYLPFGEIRTDVGTINQTDYGYTFQKYVSGMELMDYKARYYSTLLGRFTQPDTIIPGAGNPQTWNRYAYVNNSPVNFNDPSGHLACDADQEVCGIQHKPETLMGISLGNLSSSEKTIFLNNATKIANDMGGYAIFREKVGGFSVSKTTLEDEENDLAETKGNSIALRSDFFNHTDYGNPDWSIIHEIAHVWDNNTGGKLSRDLVSFTRGTYDENGYLWGGKPPKGADENFTPVEDFAESVATHYYPDVAMDFINDKFERIGIFEYSYTNYSLSTRSYYVKKLLGD